MNAIQQYRKTQVQTVDEGKLLLMLYDGALQFLREAVQGIEEKNIEKSHNNIMKVQKIISELMVSLNMEAGGEIARNLLGLYVFINKQLMTANLKKDTSLLREVSIIIRGLRDAFSEVVDTRKMPKEAPAAAPAGERRLNLQG